MPCKFVKLVGSRKSGLVVAVLDTPCSPARYYGGPVGVYWRTGEYYTCNNATSNFFRTVEEAEANAKIFLETKAKAGV